MSATSWVTLATNDSYSLGALVLGHSLRNVGTVHQLTVLVTPGVSKPMRDRLSGVFNNIREVNVLDSRDKANLALLARPDLGVTFTKLHCWRLTEFSKAVFLDADTLVLKNSDELFEREEFSAAPDAGWPDCFNSGVFVFKPSEETYQSLIQFALAHGSFDGGDQGLLNSYFADWSTKDISRHLPFIYNMVSSAFYSYLPALKQYGDKVKIVHFIGPCKPWLQYLDCETKRVRAPPGSEHLQPLLQLWWDIFCSRVHSSLTEEMAGLAGALAQLTLGVPRTAEQIALDEHLRRQAWEEGRFDYMGVDSFDNIWQKISETMAEKPESKDDHQEVVQPISHEQHSTIVAPEPRGQVSPATAVTAVDISQTPATAQIPSTIEAVAASPPPASFPEAPEPTAQKPAPVTSAIPGPEPSAVASPVERAGLSTGVVPEQKAVTHPGPLSEPTAQASVSVSEIPVAESTKDPATTVLPQSETPKALGESPTPVHSQTDLTQKESGQTLPSPTPALSKAPIIKSIAIEPPAAPTQTTAEPPLPPTAVDSTTEKTISTPISEQSPAAEVSEITQLASQPPTTTVPAVATIPSPISSPIAGISPPPAEPPMAAPAPVPTHPTLSSQPLTTPVQPVPEIQSPISPPIVASLVDVVGSSTPSAPPPLIPAPVLPAPAVPVPQEQIDSKQFPEPLAQVSPVTAVITEAAEPSENAPVLAPSPLVAAPVSKPPEKPEAVGTVPETSSVPHTPVSPTTTPQSPPSAPTMVGTVPSLVSAASVIGAQPLSTPATVVTPQKDLHSPSLPTPIPPSTIEKPPEPSTPSSVPTSPTDIRTRPMSTALVSVPKTKQKAPATTPEPPKPPIPMPAPESPSALSSPTLSVGVPERSKTETVNAPAAPAHPKEQKTEGLPGQSPKKPDKQQDTTKLGKDKGNLEELPVAQLTEADSKLSKKTKDTEHGTDSQVAPEKLPAKTPTKQAKQSKPKAPETPTKSETAVAKPASPPATEPASPEAEVAPPVTKVKTKVVKVPKGTKETVLKDVPQQDPALKMVSPPLSPPAGSPPLSPDAGKLPAPKSEAPVEKGSTAAEKGTVEAEITEQASAAPVPPKRKGAKTTASGEGSSKTQSKPTKTVLKPKK